MKKIILIFSCLMFFISFSYTINPSNIFKNNNQKYIIFYSIFSNIELVKQSIENDYFGEFIDDWKSIKKIMSSDVKKYRYKDNEYCSILDHTIYAIESVEIIVRDMVNKGEIDKSKANEYIILGRLFAFLHDIGKPFIADLSKRDTRTHAIVGDYMSWKILYNIGFSVKFCHFVSKIIRHHGVIGYFPKNDYRIVKNYKEFFRLYKDKNEHIVLLKILTLADIRDRKDFETYSNYRKISFAFKYLYKSNYQYFKNLKRSVECISLFTDMILEEIPRSKLNIISKIQLKDIFSFIMIQEKQIERKIGLRFMDIVPMFNAA